MVTHVSHVLPTRMPGDNLKPSGGNPAPHQPARVICTSSRTEELKHCVMAFKNKNKNTATEAVTERSSRHNSGVLCVLGKPGSGAEGLPSLKDK